MASPPLQYVGLPSGHSDGKPPRLQLASPGGSIREVPLRRHQLTSLIKAAALALEHMDREEARAAASD